MFRILIISSILFSSSNLYGQELVNKNGKFFKKICRGNYCELVPVEMPTFIPEKKEEPAVESTEVISPYSHKPVQKLNKLSNVHSTPAKRVLRHKFSQRSFRHK